MPNCTDFNVSLGSSDDGQIFMMQGVLNTKYAVKGERTVLLNNLASQPSNMWPTSTIWSFQNKAKVGLLSIAVLLLLSIPDHSLVQYNVRPGHIMRPLDGRKDRCIVLCRTLLCVRLLSFRLAMGPAGQKVSHQFGSCQYNFNHANIPSEISVDLCRCMAAQCWTLP